MSATIHDVARLAKVSATAVSLAFRPGSRIGDATRKRVQTAARRLEYVPNLVARNLRQGGTMMLGLLINDITNPFYTMMARKVELVARSAGYRIILAESQWDSAEEVKALEGMAQERVAGVLACFCESGDDGWQVLRKIHIPHIALDSIPPGYNGSFVVNDLRAAGEMAARHLAEAGCRRPAMLVPSIMPRGFSAFRLLLEGFAQGLCKSGIRFCGRCVYDAELTIAGGVKGYAILRKGMPDADGVLCGNDLCAYGVMEAAWRDGVRIGSELAVMGIDDLDFSRLACVGLTSIRQPLERIAEAATRGLVEAIESKGEVRRRMSLPPELVARASTVR